MHPPAPILSSTPPVELGWDPDIDRTLHMTEMIYRRLGRTGVKVSVLSIGSWVTYDAQVGVDAAVEQLDAARSHGVNFFDNAESYAGGKSEEIMGGALHELDWPRHSY